MRKSKDVYWSKDPKINSKTFTFPNFYDKTPTILDFLVADLPPLETKKVTVVEVKDGWNWYAKYYWIFSFPRINALYSGGIITGEGKKKYEHIILEAIKRFQTNNAKEGQFVKLCDDYLIKPAVMYDKKDFHVYSTGDWDHLELNYKTKNYISSDDKVRNHHDIQLLKLPLDQNVIDDIWNWGTKGLLRYLDSEKYIEALSEKTEENETEDNF